MTVVRAKGKVYGNQHGADGEAEAKADLHAQVAEIHQQSAIEAGVFLPQLPRNGTPKNFPGDPLSTSKNGYQDTHKKKGEPEGP